MNIDSSLKLYGPSQIQANSIEKTDRSKEIEEVKDEESKLVFSQEFTGHKSSLSHSIQNINGGILTTLIAQKGLEYQSEVLGEIKNEILGLEGDIGLNEKNQIARLINKFEQISGIAGHNRQTPLQVSEDISKNDLSIVSDSAIIEISSVDTLGISNTLKSYLNTLDHNSSQNMLNDIDTGITKLGEYKDEFNNAFESLSSIAREYIEAEKGKISTKIDYSKEVEEFSKENILSRKGPLVASQANTAQDRAMPLMVS